MTTNQASAIFGIDPKEVRKRIKDNMVNYTRERRIYIIPDNTKILPSKQQIQAFLFQIIKYKNNPNIVISRNLCPNEETLKAVVEYLYNNGYIGDYSFESDIVKLFDGIMLTDKAFDFVFTAKSITKINVPIELNMPITLNINLNLIRIGG